jgi:hypothetical protein
MEVTSCMRMKTAYCKYRYSGATGQKRTTRTFATVRTGGQAIRATYYIGDVAELQSKLFNISLENVSDSVAPDCSPTD